MTLKRRRERDKPKAGPDAPYNPNKRVLLSYASDEDKEVEDASERQHGASVDDRSAADDQVEAYYENDDNVKLGAERPADETTSEIRDDAVQPELEEEEEEEEEQESTPNQRNKTSKRWGTNVRRNERTNQFPQLGLVSYQWDEEDNDEEYDSTTEEAMAYLRAVRSERQGIPEVLSAIHQDNEQPDDPVADAVDDAMEDETFHDGVWVAPASSTAPAEDDSSPQKAYTRNITDRFFDQRRQLRLPPKADALAELDDSYPISFPKGNNKACAEWHRLLSMKPPRLAQLQSLDQETVFHLLDLLQTRVLTPGKNIKKHVSNWIWSLLARLEDVGNMTNDQVYPLRELGKKAVFLQYSLTQPKVAAQLQAIGQAGVTMHNPDEIPLDDSDDETPDRSTSGTLARSEPHPNITDNTLVTLDMILVVVGEVYGQRDLLDFRTSWKPEVAPA